MGGLRLTSRQSLQEELTYELSQSVDLETEAHWQKKILEGIIPIELRIQGELTAADMKEHFEELTKLAKFEESMLEQLFENEWKVSPKSPISEMHYFGIGTGDGLARVAPLANAYRHAVVAYDTCSAGLENGERVFEKLQSGIVNSLRLADILFACHKRYIRPGKASKLVASRVLDVLDKQEPGWAEKPPAFRKTARTARRIGRLLSHVEVFIIHRCPEDNPTAIWADSHPHTLSEVLGYMEEGAKSLVEYKCLGEVTYHGHLHRGIYIRKAA